MQARKDEDEAREAAKRKKRSSHAAPGQDVAAGTGHAFAEAIMMAKRQGGAENLPYFLEEGLAVPIMKPNGEKLPKDYKTPIQPRVDEEPSEIIPD